MEFVFDERKAAQAAAYLLHRHGKPMEYIKLIKLLYLADRRALVETGQPITGDRLVSMPKGPVLSEVLDLIRTENEDDLSAWHEYVSIPVNYKVHAIGPSNLEEVDDELSEYDQSVLDAIFDKFGRFGYGKLINYTHALPEWIDPKGSSIDIDLHVILEDAGLSKDTIAQVEDDAAASHALHTRYVVSR